MSGDWNHLGEQLGQEVKSALALLFKHVETHGVDCCLEQSYTIFDTQLPCVTQGINPVMAAPLTYDALNRDNDRAQCIEYPLGFDEQKKSVQESCHWEAVMVSEPVFSATSAALHEITFNNVQVSPVQMIPVGEMALSRNLNPHPIQKLTPEKIVGSSQSIAIPKSFTKALEHRASKIKTLSRLAATRLWVLPIKRTPIPPHRFSTETRAVFRDRLAEKAKTRSANIQIKVVFDRLDIAMFSNIDQDDRGNLLCFPKLELIPGKSFRPLRMRNTQTTSYLVFGTRVDTGETVKALVPLAELEASLSEREAD